MDKITLSSYKSRTSAKPSQNNKSMYAVELTSKLPEVTNVSYANMITEKFMGIPQNLDLQKRDIARDILEKNKDIASIFFVIPKGDTKKGYCKGYS